MLEGNLAKQEVDYSNDYSGADTDVEPVAFPPAQQAK